MRINRGRYEAGRDNNLNYQPRMTHKDGREAVTVDFSC
jgi:hypothetical protein